MATLLSKFRIDCQEMTILTDVGKRPSEDRSVDFLWIYCELSCNNNTCVECGAKSRTNILGFVLHFLELRWIKNQHQRGYKHSLLLKYMYFKQFCSAYNIEGKYGEKNSDLLFSRMLKHSPSVSCDIHNIKEIKDIVKASYVKIMPLTRSLGCEWKSKSPLTTNVFHVVHPFLTHWI